ncbi:MAG: ChbG/HpnK family deacetylase [Granulosicoccus sp.]
MSNDKPVLCADDFGLSARTSAGILQLVDRKKLSAVSVMTNLRPECEHLPELLQSSSCVSIGVHINLTVGPRAVPAHSQSLNEGHVGLFGAIWRSVGQTWDKKWLHAEIHRQLEIFEQWAGMTPDHIDGHQHVHAFPQVSSILLAVLKERYRGIQILIRDPAPEFHAGVANMHTGAAKQLLLKGLLAGFGRKIKNAGFLSNGSFGGYSGFSDTGSYWRELREAFEKTGAGGIIMCHPGQLDPLVAEFDTVIKPRSVELDVLLGEKVEDLIFHPERHSQSSRIVWPLELQA